MTTDTSEKGLEGLIVAAMTGLREAPAREEGGVSEPPTPYGGTGWLYGHAEDYDREYCVDLVPALRLPAATQPKVVEALDLGQDGPTRRRFLARLQGEIRKRGVIDVLRKGVKHGPHHLDLFYGTPSPGNDRAQPSCTRRTASASRASSRYSTDETRCALDLCLFINGLPIATFELKNSLTKQTVEDAVAAVQARPRPARAAVRVRPLRGALRGGRQRGADVHRSCKGKGSWFLPFNKG